MVHVLVAEDDPGLARFLDLELTHEGYAVTVVGDGRRALTEAESGRYDVALIDIMLPQLSGLEVCRRVRLSSNLPIILVTARDSVPDKVSGLDAGADDYLPKPFAIEELLARLRVRLRQRPGREEGAGVITVADLVIDTAGRRASRGGVELDLTKTEFDLLVCLASHADVVLTRDKLLHEVWAYDYSGSSNLVDVFIGYLRSKVDRDAPVKLIHTVRGVGYVIRPGEE